MEAETIATGNAIPAKQPYSDLRGESFSDLTWKLLNDPNGIHFLQCCNRILIFCIMLSHMSRRAGGFEAKSSPKSKCVRCIKVFCGGADDWRAEITGRRWTGW